MKKVISLILALVMILPLCACASEESKYVGVYRKGSFNNTYVWKLHIDSDGSYYTEMFDYDTSAENGEGDFIEREEGTWTEVDGYLVLDGGMQYELNGIYLLYTGVDVHPNSADYMKIL